MFGYNWYNKERYESTWVVVVYLIFLPIGGFVFKHVWTLIIEMCCDKDEPKVQEMGTPTNRTMAIAPMLTKLPPNFKFANYVNEGLSDGSISSGAFSLDSAIKIRGLLGNCVLCAPCACGQAEKPKMKMGSIPNVVSEQILGATENEATKLADVAKWLGLNDSAVARGGAIIFDTMIFEPLKNSKDTTVSQFDSRSKPSVSSV
ncbi:hypothetical protein RRG08_037083 [Elysia crispata]|uniref:Uncharacterized protein n=1 Tax=Elysia crispata TaxID=231223 RepID=A0AAE0ZXT0_9GAST|nr:hypothetical protein RRG08_037083 [Elysia crispata]